MFKGVEWKKIVLLLKHSKEIFVLKPLYVCEISHSSDMQNDVLMHREGLKG